MAAVPLPCSNLPLDHPRQGHRVRPDRRERGGAAPTTKDLLGRPARGVGATFKMRACHCGNECARTRGLLDICGNAGVSWNTPTKTQEHAIPSHRRTNTSPPKPTPPQREGTNRFLPCGVSELLRQTEQELTMGRSLHARNAQMGPRMLQHLLSTPTQSRQRPAPGLEKNPNLGHPVAK